MWLADGWKDYQVIDCSKGEKLERWGEYLLVRPDPQVIWDTPKTHRGWKHMNGHYHRSAKGGGEWEFFDLPKQWEIGYTLPSGKKLTFVPDGHFFQYPPGRESATFIGHIKETSEEFLFRIYDREYFLYLLKRLRTVKKESAQDITNIKL